MAGSSTKSRLQFASTILLALCWVAILGCRSRSESQAERQAEKQAETTADRPRIALIMKSLANEFFSTMADGAKRHQAEHPNQYELIVNGIKDEVDVTRQVSLVEEMVAQNVNAIVIAPADSKILVPVLKRAQAAGIAVVNIDNKLDSEVLAKNDTRIPFVGPDNRAGARKAAEYMARQLKRGDKVAIVEGLRTAFNGQQRLLGFQEAMKAAGLEIVASQSGEWEMAKGNAIASAMLSEHPDLKALLCGNDSMALGAVAAVKDAGRAGTVAIVGFDDISAVRAAVKDGSITATVEQHADKLAVYGIEYALKIIQDKSSPEDKETPVEIITAETFKAPAK